MPADSRLLVARIGKPHGLNGEVTVQTHTDDPEARYVPGMTYETQAVAGSGVPKSLTLRSARLHQQTWLLGFEEIPDRTGAESLRGTRLFIDAEERRGRGRGRRVVRGRARRAGGRTTPRVRLSARSPVCAPEPPRTSSCCAWPNGSEALVPFVEAIVPEVDVAAGRVVVDAPPGLLELNAE